MRVSPASLGCACSPAPMSPVWPASHPPAGGTVTVSPFVPSLPVRKDRRVTWDPGSPLPLPSESESLSCCAPTAPRGRAFESGLGGGLSGRARCRCWGSWGASSPLPASQTGKRVRPARPPQDWRPGEKPLYFLLLLSPLRATISDTQNVLTASVIDNEISSFEASTMY